MAIRRTNFRASAITLSASSTVTLTSAEIPTDGLRALHFRILKVGAGGGDFFGATGVEKIRVKAGGQTIIEGSYKSLRAWIRRLSYAQRDTMDGSSRVFTLPFYFMDGQNQAEQDACAFPPGQNITLELVTGSAVANSPTLLVGWTRSDQAPKFFPMYLDQFLNWSASNSAQTYALRQNGILRGLTLPTQGLTAIKFHQGGNDIFVADGPNVSTEGDMIGATQMLESASYSYGDHVHLRLDTGLPMTPGAAWLQADTGSDFQVAQPENSCGIYSIVPVG